MQKIVCLTALVLVLFASFGEAAPSAGGETGTLAAPSADFMRAGQFHLGWQYRSHQRTAAAAAALTNRFEFSILQRSRSGHQTVEAGFKYAVRPETIFTPGIAVGVEDVAAEYQRSVYAVMTKELPYGIRVHAGIGSGRYRGGFAAAEVRLFPQKQPGMFPDTTLYAEHADRHAVYGIRIALIRGASFVAGIDGHEHFVGLSYNFY